MRQDRAHRSTTAAAADSVTVHPPRGVGRPGALPASDRAENVTGADFATDDGLITTL